MFVRCLRNLRRSRRYFSTTKTPYDRTAQRELAQAKSQRAIEYAELNFGGISPSSSSVVPFLNTSSNFPKFLFLMTGVTGIIGLSVSPFAKSFLPEETQNQIDELTAPIQEVFDNIAIEATSFSTAPSRFALDPLDRDQFPTEPITVVISLDDFLISRSWTLTTGWRTAIRPGAIDFLTYLTNIGTANKGPSFEVILCTNEDSMSAEEYLNMLNKKMLVRLNPAYASRDSFNLPKNFQVVDKKYFTEQKKEKQKDEVFATSKHYIKHLEKFNRRAEKVIFIDTDPVAVNPNVENAILMNPFNKESNNADGEELHKLQLFFKALVNSEGIRKLKPISESKDVRNSLSYFKVNRQKDGRFDLDKVYRRVGPLLGMQEQQKRRRVREAEIQQKQREKVQQGNNSEQGQRTSLFRAANMNKLMEKQRKAQEEMIRQHREQEQQQLDEIEKMNSMSYQAQSFFKGFTDSIGLTQQVDAEAE